MLLRGRPSFVENSGPLPCSFQEPGSLGGSFPKMRSRAFRRTAAVLCILMCAGTPVLAGPVVVNQVVQVLGVNQNPVSLRLQNSHQNSDAAASGARGSRIDGTWQGWDSSVGVSDGPDTLLAGVSVVQGQDASVDIDQDDVEGTICDCGEILVAGAAFTAWPFFFIGAVPLFFITDDNPPETPTPTPTPPVPTPTPTPPQPVPEPATLLLLGTGLAAIGASLRRRRAKQQSKEQVPTEEG